jgi:DNA-binding transcriptional ArsR family regulator
MKIEEILSSKARLRIMLLLLKHGEMNITRISKESYIDHQVASEHLKFLQRYGLIEEKRFGRIRIFKIKDQDHRIMALRRFVNEWERSESSVRV